MSGYSFLHLTMTLFLFGCSHLYTGRTYLDEMEHDDTSFFTPDQDFPIMAGDSGRYWLTAEERRMRTPGSIEDKELDSLDINLQKELQVLLELQPDEERSMYSLYAHYFSNISEKIYFLKLPLSEREDYLVSRGFLKIKPLTSVRPTGRLPAYQNQLVAGMTREEVKEFLGEPAQVDLAKNPWDDKERWTYEEKAPFRYVYFESGKVQIWE